MSCLETSIADMRIDDTDCLGKISFRNYTARRFYLQKFFLKFLMTSLATGLLLRFLTWPRFKLMSWFTEFCRFSLPETQVLCLLWWWWNWCVRKTCLHVQWWTQYVNDFQDCHAALFKKRHKFMSESTTVKLKCQKPEEIDISGRMSL